MQSGKRKYQPKPVQKPPYQNHTKHLQCSTSPSTSNKKLLVAPGITTSNKKLLDLLVTRHLTSSNKGITSFLTLFSQLCQTLPRARRRSSLHPDWDLGGAPRGREALHCTGGRCFNDNPPLQGMSWNRVNKETSLAQMEFSVYLVSFNQSSPWGSAVCHHAPIAMTSKSHTPLGFHWFHH